MLKSIATQESRAHYLSKAGGMMWIVFLNLGARGLRIAAEPCPGQATTAGAFGDNNVIMHLFSDTEPLALCDLSPVSQRT